MKSEVRAFIKSMRPKHWIKNILILLPAIFGMKIGTADMLLKLIWGGVMFSLIASGIYIINDVHDSEKDALHPIKCKRPIAAGVLGKEKAMTGAIILLVIGFCGSIIPNRDHWLSITLILSTYIVSNLAYSIFGAKKIPVLDIVIVSLGYVLRIFLGGSISSTEISTWLFVTILCISFFMSAQKRLKEMERGTDHRDVLQDYSTYYLRAAGIVTLCAGIVFFILWAMDIGANRGGHYFPYVASGIGVLSALLYLYDAEKSDSGDPVDVILNDWVLIIMAIVFAVCFVMNI